MKQGGRMGLWKTLLGEARLRGAWRVGWDAWVLPGPLRLCGGLVVRGCAGAGWGAEDACSESPRPSRSRDFYHTCYCLSGLSIAQHFGSGAMLHDVVLGVPENALVRWDGGLTTASPQGPQDGAGRRAEHPLLASRTGCTRTRTG